MAKAKKTPPIPEVIPIETGIESNSPKGPRSRNVLFAYISGFLVCSILAAGLEGMIPFPTPLAYGVMMFFIFLAITEKKKETGDLLLEEGFKVGLLIILINIIFVFAFSFIYFKAVRPHFFDDHKMEWIKQLKDANVKPLDIDRNIESRRAYFTPFVQATSQISGFIFIGGLFTFVFSLIKRTKTGKPIKQKS